MSAGVYRSTIARRPVAAIAFGLTAIVALLVYLLTLAPDLAWAYYGTDGGELITASVTLGVPHPPGYPTYVLLGKLMSRLPLDPPAVRFNLFSALCTALAAGLVSVISYQLSVISKQSSVIGDETDHRTLMTDYWPLITGLTFAFMPLVWRQAVIAEVYGLNLLVLAAFLWALFGPRPGFLPGLFLGLGITTHLTSLFMLPLALTHTPRTQWPRLALGLLLGLTPFLALPLLARSGSPVIWGDPTTLQGWWWLVSAQIYRPNVFAFPAGEWWPRFVTWGKGLFAQFAWIGLPLLPAGLSLTWPLYRRRHLSLLGTAALYALYAFGYNTGDAAVYFLPGLLLLSILLADALRHIGSVAYLLPLALLLLNFNGISLRGATQARAIAAPILQAAPPDAIVLTTGDQTTFTLWYLQHVEAHRPDVTIVDTNLFAFSWYRNHLGRQHPALRGVSQDDLDGFRAANRQRYPVCTVKLTVDPVAVATNQCTPAQTED